MNQIKASFAPSGTDLRNDPVSVGSRYALLDGEDVLPENLVAVKLIIVPSAEWPDFHLYVFGVQI